MEIVNTKGLHARASRKFAETALKFQSDVMVRKDDEEANARSLMDLMMLGAGMGAQIEVIADGPDAEEALDALAKLVADRFREGE
ncbi:MAG: HPr family phosphocarrier protein [Alphaproteobacteria bacterium]|nr:HPr family phosphocarrier protein [Alphaproteobacteria bacterium]